VHVNKRRRVAEVDDNGGAGANVSCQLPGEPPIVTWYTCHKTPVSVVGAAPWCAGLSDQDRVRRNASRASAAMVAPRAVEQR
jgi:hypothetical protein